MRNAEITGIQEVIQQLITQSTHKHKFIEASVIDTWKKVMPLAILKRTRRLFVSKNTLFIKLDSAPLKHELQMSKSKIIQRLKEANQDCDLADVVFL